MNIYDDRRFLKKYSQMSRSRLGLEGSWGVEDTGAHAPRFLRKAGVGPGVRLRMALRLRSAARGGPRAGAGPLREHAPPCPGADPRDGGGVPADGAGGVRIPGGGFRRGPQLAGPALCERLLRCVPEGGPHLGPGRGLRLFYRAPRLYGLWGSRSGCTARRGDSLLAGGPVF